MCVCTKTTDYEVETRDAKTRALAVVYGKYFKQNLSMFYREIGCIPTEWW